MCKVSSQSEGGHWIGAAGGGVASPRCMQAPRNSLKFFPKKLKVIRFGSDFGFRGFAYGFFTGFEGLGSNPKSRGRGVGGGCFSEMYAGASK